MAMMRAYRAGEQIEDYCRACKLDRMHTIVVVDAGGQPVRVTCGYCRSEHNYRGGPRVEAWTGSAPADRDQISPAARPAERPARRAPAPAHASLPLVSERERVGGLDSDLEVLLRRIIREETGLTAVAPAEKWRGGHLVLRPGTPGLQEKTWPIETFFHKVVMLRNRLRTLEQQINAADLPDDVKIRLQGYISGCYGSLTSFNVLFAEEADQFKGTGGD
jgi:hypothetical protein